MSDDTHSGNGSERGHADEIEESVRAEMEAKEPSEARKEELREEHRNHLVRDTESDLTIDLDVAEGMGAEATVTVPDLYCFSCEEWVGLSGIDLRGTPRSRADAYYLDGAPEGVEDTRHRVTHDVADLVEMVAENVPHVGDAEDALEFIETEIEQAKERIEKRRQVDELRSLDTDSDQGGDGA